MGVVGVSWLLSAVRRYGSDRRMRVATAFADGGGRAPPVHRSQVTRWENGQAIPTYALVRRYETVLGLPERQLLTATDYLTRSERLVSAGPWLRRPPPDDLPARSEELLEAALGPTTMTGADWDDLSNSLSELPAALLRRGDWIALIRRGVLEMSVSLGLGYAERAEALSRIAGHPRAAAAVVDVVEALLAEPGTQIYSEPIALLQFCPDPRVPDLLLRQLIAPTDLNALRASLFATANVLRDRPVSARFAAESARRALDWLRDADTPYRVRRSAADVLLAQGRAVRPQVGPVLRADTGDAASVAILAGRGPLPEPTATGVRTRVAHRIAREVHSELHGDEQLGRMLDATISETNDERRGALLAMLMLTPFGYPVGRAYAAELAVAVSSGRTTLVHEGLGGAVLAHPDRGPRPGHRARLLRAEPGRGRGRVGARQRPRAGRPRPCRPGHPAGLHPALRSDAGPGGCAAGGRLRARHARPVGPADRGRPRRPPVGGQPRDLLVARRTGSHPPGLRADLARLPWMTWSRGLFGW